MPLEYLQKDLTKVDSDESEDELYAKGHDLSDEEEEEVTTEGNSTLKNSVDHAEEKDHGEGEEKSLEPQPKDSDASEVSGGASPHARSKDNQLAGDSRCDSIINDSNNSDVEVDDDYEFIFGPRSPSKTTKDPHVGASSPPPHPSSPHHHSNPRPLNEQHEESSLSVCSVQAVCNSSLQDVNSSVFEPSSPLPHPPSSPVHKRMRPIKEEEESTPTHSTPIKNSSVLGDPASSPIPSVKGDSFTFSDNYSPPRTKRSPHYSRSPFSSPVEAQPPNTLESSASPPHRHSPPQPPKEEAVEPPPRPQLVKLVIKNDGKNYSSKVVESKRERSSRKKARRALRARMQLEGAEGGKRKEVKLEGKEEVEYIDPDNSIYSRGVSVTLERLPEKTTQEYSLGKMSFKRSPHDDKEYTVSVKNSPSVVISGVSSGVVNNDASGGGFGSDKSSSRGDNLNHDHHQSSKSSKKSKESKRSGRKRRREEKNAVKKEEREAREEVGVKRVRKTSGVSGGGSSSCDDGGVFRESHDGALPTGVSPAFRDRDTASPVSSMFYVGNATETLDHFESDDDGRPYYDEEEDSNRRGSLGFGGGADDGASLTFSDAGSHHRIPSPVFSSHKPLPPSSFDSVSQPSDSSNRQSAHRGDRHFTQSFADMLDNREHRLDCDEPSKSQPQRHHGLIKPPSFSSNSRSAMDFSEFVPESPTSSVGAGLNSSNSIPIPLQSRVPRVNLHPHPPSFAGHIPPGHAQSESMFDSSPPHEMDTSFTADPQGSMVTQHVQHAIDNVLNGSSSSTEGRGHSHSRARSNSSRQSHGRSRGDSRRSGHSYDYSHSNSRSGTGYSHDFSSQ